VFLGIATLVARFAFYHWLFSKGWYCIFAMVLDEWDVERARCTSLWNLAALRHLGHTKLVMDRSSIANLLRRCLRLKCPVCGNASIVKAPFRIKDHCPICRAVFQREQGFFVGAILVNVVTTELVILLAYLTSLPFINTYYKFVLVMLFVIAVAFPVAFYHHSWSVWLTFDHLVEGLPKSKTS
jgi:uncharacterized protein (DUF983 family)